MVAGVLACDFKAASVITGFTREITNEQTGNKKDLQIQNQELSQV